MENLQEITDSDATDRPVIINNESGCGEVVVNVNNNGCGEVSSVNVNNVTNNYYTFPEWFTEDFFQRVLERLGSGR